MADERQGAPPRVHPRTLALAAAGVAVAVLAAAVLMAVLNEPLPDAGATEPPTDAAGFQALDLDGRIDSDGDGLADATENYVTGTDAKNWSSNGDPIPDGWLAKAGRDPLRTGAAFQPAARPPASAVPAAWGPDGVNRLTPSLWDVYSYGRPATWDEPTMGPWQNGLDPNDWDQDDDGVPDGFLLRHGLDPAARLRDARPAGGLSVYEAYQHATDPTKLDSDGDGLSDRAEIDGSRIGAFDVPPSDPTRFDSNGAGACDGYLAHHGIDPNDGDAARSDPDRDGATTAEEAIWSLENLGPTACSGGPALDPHDATSGDAQVPDGWLIKHGLDPLQPGVDTAVTQKASTDPGPKLDGVADLVLTVRDEYNANKSPDWNEATQGPWPHGTDPTKLDTDGDGLGDAWELRGYGISVTTDVGSAEPADYLVRPDPTRTDTDGDGVPDGGEANADPATDATRRDTDLDGLSDQFESTHPDLDPLRADSAGDLLRDGQRFLLLEGAARKYGADTTYECPGDCVHADVRDWLETVPGAAGLLPLDAADVSALVGPDGDLDGDGLPNIIDPDMDGDGLPNGVEVDPVQYARTSFGLGPLGARPASDPLNPDTDGDGLRDGWEVEYGVPLAGGYDLDPSDWDSDDDGTSDGNEDPDGDGITWFSFRSTGTGTRPDARTFVHDNLSEQQYETHPRKASTDGDGLRDGWKVFWGQVYPGTVGTDPAARGDVYPGSPGAFAIDPQRPTPVVGLDQSGTTIASAKTHRVALLDAPDDRLHPDEQQGKVFPGVDDGAGGVHDLVEWVGERPFTFLDAQASLANPYLDDTDGDGMPDAWEWAHATTPDGPGCQGTNGPRPATPDADADPDGDGLDNLQEYNHRLVGEHSLHPLCGDHDHGTLPDGEEVDLGLDPTNPADDLFDDGLDQDGDGLTDLEERRTFGTNPLNVDTDGDGLLDGGNVGPLAPGSLEARRLLELGIAVQVEQGGLRFLGEGFFNTSPTDPDPHGVGVPQGWLILRCGDCINNPPSNIRDAYTIGIPSWWDEAVHGPWWGGGVTFEEVSDPTAARAADDLDEDGLLDHLGEDPLPAVNRANAPAPVTPEAHPRLTAWDPGTDPTDPAAGDLERRLAAQALLNPRTFVSTGGVGRDPDPSTQTQPPAQTRSASSLALDPVGTILKEQPFTVSGTLAAPGAIDGVTVVAELDGQPVGAGFTDPDGAFSFPAEVTAEHAVSVPSGSILMGQVGGTAAWTVDTGSIRLGGSDLRVYSYATPDTPPHTDDRAALERTEATTPVILRTPTLVSIDAPPEVPAGESFDVTIITTDASGDPRRDPVTLTTPHGTVTLPNSEGKTTRTIQSTAGDAGPFRISATTQPASSHVDPGSAEKTPRVLQPVKVVLSLLPDSIHAGGNLDVRGTVHQNHGTAAGPPVAGVPVTLRAGGEPVQVTTRADGGFQALLTVPADRPAGDLPVQANAVKTDTTLSGGTSRSIVVLGLPSLTDTSPPLLSVGDAVVVKGMLRDSDGAPLAHAAVTYAVGDRTGTAKTLADGTFEEELDWAPPPGPSRQTLRYGGDARHAPVERHTERFMVSDTVLLVEPDEVVRGTGLELVATLSDAAGRPVPGVPLLVVHDDASTPTLTGADGAATLRLDTTGWRLGPNTITVTYAGSGDGALRKTTSQTVWTVVSDLRIEQPDGPFHAGQTPTQPRLVDAGTGDGVVRALTLTSPDGTTRTVTTAADGSFDLFGTVPLDTEPSTLTWRVAAPADDAYPALDEELSLRVASPTTPRVQFVGDLVSGKQTDALVSVHDGRGIPGDGEVRVLLDDRLVGRAHLVDGSVRLPVTPDAPGPALLVVEFLGSQDQAPARHEETVQVLRPTQLRLDVTENDGRARIQVTATRDGEPLAFRGLHLSIEDLPGGVSLETDADGRASFEHVRSRDGVAVAVRLATESGEEPSLATAVLGAPGHATPSLSAALPTWIGLTLAPLLVIALLITAGALWNRRSPLDQELRHTLRTLRGRGAAEEVILHGYYVLQRAALRRGWLDDEAATPRVLQETLAAEVKRMPAEPLDALIGLFERARYGDRRMGPPHREEAIRALNAIRRTTAWGSRA